MAKKEEQEKVGAVSGFLNFIREQGVVGLAIGVVVGVAAKDTVDALTQGFINPLIGLILPKTDALSEKVLTISDSEFAWGRILLSLINLIIVAAVVYFVIKGLRLDKLDKKK